MSSQARGSTRSGCVIPNQRVVVVPAPVQISPPQPSEKDASGVRIEREGDLVRVIEVTCACGESIRLICDYAPQTADAGHAIGGEFERQGTPDHRGGLRQ